MCKFHCVPNYFMQCLYVSNAHKHITFINHIRKSFTCQSHRYIFHAIVPYALPLYVFMRIYLSSLFMHITIINSILHISFTHIHLQLISLHPNTIHILIYIHCIYLYIYIHTYTHITYITYSYHISCISYTCIKSHAYSNCLFIYAVHSFIYISHTIPFLYAHSINMHLDHNFIYHLCIYCIRIPLHTFHTHIAYTCFS